MKKFFLPLFLLLFLSGSYIGTSQVLINSFDTFPITTSYDTDAQAYFDVNTGLTTTQKDAVNTLVLDLKTYSLWTKIYAFYPLVGGTASAHKWNLIDPRDLDVAYRLTFFGTITHNSSGIQSDGTSGYANIHFNPTTDGWTTSDAGMGIYKTGTEAGGTNRTYIGNNYGSTNMGWIASGTEESFTIAGSNDFTPQSPQAQKTGVLFGSMTSGNVGTYYVDGTSTGNKTHNGSLTNSDLYLLALNNGGSPLYYCANTIIKCAYLTQGLNATEAANLSTAITDYQTNLGRNN